MNVKWNTLTQRLRNRMRHPLADQQQRIARWEARVRRWKKIPRRAAPVDPSMTPNVTGEQKGRRFRLPQGQRADRSMDQLYDEVDKQAVVSLAHFHTFLDAEELLLNAREAETDIGDNDFVVPIGTIYGTPPVTSPPDEGRDSMAKGGSTDGQADEDDGWDEDAQAGMWENSNGA